MLYSVSGNLITSMPQEAYYLAVVECGGIGYEIKTTYQSMAQTPKPGTAVRFYTSLVVREDAVELFGFASQEELRYFKMLTSVSGVGPKAALSILSDLSTAQFALCVASGDSKSLTKVKGIGLKTAQRVVLELKDKISKEAPGAAAVELPDAKAMESGSMAEAIAALEALGYSRSQAAQVLAGQDPESTTEALIKAGLKTLSSQGA